MPACVKQLELGVPEAPDFILDLGELHWCHLCQASAGGICEGGKTCDPLDLAPCSLVVAGQMVRAPSRGQARR